MSGKLKMQFADLRMCGVKKTETKKETTLRLPMVAFAL